MLSLKVVFLVSCLIFVADTRPNSIGGVQQLKGAERKEAVQILRKSLSELAANDGPSYTLSRVYSVTGQVVSGTLYRYVVDLKENKKTKRCKASIWYQPWLENDTELTIKCRGEPTLVKKQNNHN